MDISTYLSFCCARLHVSAIDQVERSICRIQALGIGMAGHLCEFLAKEMNS